MTNRYILATVLIIAVGFSAMIFNRTTIANYGDDVDAKPFYWCAATSAHQIEGGNSSSDWWLWEQEDGRIANNERSGKATDHWNRVSEDIALIKSLKLSMYRLSIEWAKLEPQEGVWDQRAIAHYRDEISMLNRNGIQPMITLHHFTLPLWVAEKGGWEWSGAAQAFKIYAARVVKEIAPKNKWWVTFNEPMILLSGGYLAGSWPPGKKGDFKALFQASDTLLNAHAQVYRIIHSNIPNAKVGLAHHLRIFDPLSAFNVLDRAAAHLLRENFNWAMPDAVQTGTLKFSLPLIAKHKSTIPGLSGTQDFLGINYYTRDLVEYDGKEPMKFRRSTKIDSAKSDMGWEIYPEGFLRILRESYERYSKLPILVTENGIADSSANEETRPEFIRSHIAALELARKKGVEILGYCHWSLLDNFEWTHGFGPRFGLFEVDYNTFKRRPRSKSIDALTDRMKSLR